MINTASYRLTVSSCWILVLLAVIFTSCSINITKRRYRPGYHVEYSMIKNGISHPTTHSEVQVNINHNSAVRLRNVGDSLPPPILKPRVVMFYKDNLNSRTVKSCSKGNYYKTISNSEFNKARETLRLNATKNYRSKKIASWVLWGVAILFMVAFILLSVLTNISSGLQWFIFLFLPAYADFFAILGVAIRYIGAKKQMDYLYRPQINLEAFITALLTFLTALTGMIISLLLQPFSMAGFVINIISIATGVISFSMGFQALKDSKSAFAILAVILGFLSLIMSAVGFLGVFGL